MVILNRDNVTFILTTGLGNLKNSEVFFFAACAPSRSIKPRVVHYVFLY
jgi:hypothetical protein